MNEIFLFIIAFLVGVLTRYVDLIEDHKAKSFRYANIIFGCVYGLLIIFAVVNFTAIAPLVIGTIIGLFIANKIDRIGHVAGVSIFIILLLFFYFNFEVDIIFVYLVIIFAVVNFIEEKLNNMFDKIKTKKLFGKILNYRPLLEVATFIISAYTGLWILWFTLFSYDIGYNLLGLVLRKNIF